MPFWSVNHWYAVNIANKSSSNVQIIKNKKLHCTNYTTVIGATLTLNVPQPYAPPQTLLHLCAPSPTHTMHTFSAPFKTHTVHLAPSKCSPCPSSYLFHTLLFPPHLAYFQILNLYTTKILIVMILIGWKGTSCSNNFWTKVPQLG